MQAHDTLVEEKALLLSRAPAWGQNSQTHWTFRTHYAAMTGPRPRQGPQAQPCQLSCGATRESQASCGLPNPLCEQQPPIHSDAQATREPPSTVTGWAAAQSRPPTPLYPLPSHRSLSPHGLLIPRSHPRGKAAVGEAGSLTLQADRGSLGGRTRGLQQGCGSTTYSLCDSEPQFANLYDGRLSPPPGAVGKVTADRQSHAGP